MVFESLRHDKFCRDDKTATRTFPGTLRFLFHVYKVVIGFEESGLLSKPCQQPCQILVPETNGLRNGKCIVNMTKAVRSPSEEKLYYNKMPLCNISIKYNYFCPQTPYSLVSNCEYSNF